MAPYIQTNEAGYVTGIVEEELLCGLFGGKQSKEITPIQAKAIESLLRGTQARGEGLLFKNLAKLLEE